MKTKHKYRWLGKSYVAVEEREESGWLVGWKGLPRYVNVMHDGDGFVACSPNTGHGLGKSVHMAMKDLEKTMLRDFKALGRVLGYEVVG